MYSYVCMSFVITSLSEGQHVSLLQDHLMAGESSIRRPCLTNEVYDNPRLSRVFTLMFPFLWH